MVLQQWYLNWQLAVTIVRSQLSFDVQFYVHGLNSIVRSPVSKQGSDKASGAWTGNPVVNVDRFPVFSQAVHIRASEMFSRDGCCWW